MSVRMVVLKDAVGATFEMFADQEITVSEQEAVGFEKCGIARRISVPEAATIQTPETAARHTSRGRARA